MKNSYAACADMYTQELPRRSALSAAPRHQVCRAGRRYDLGVEHIVGVAKGAPEDIINDLREFHRRMHGSRHVSCDGPCRSPRGVPEIAAFWEKAAYEEAEHAAKFAELLGEVVTDSTKKNLEMRLQAENGATGGKTDLAKRAKALNLDAIHDTVHEMARDEARHGRAFKGLLERYFGK